MNIKKERWHDLHEFSQCLLFSLQNWHRVGTKITKEMTLWQVSKENIKRKMALWWVWDSKIWSMQTNCDANSHLTIDNA
jgi:hypothetical protein